MKYFFYILLIASHLLSMGIALRILLRHNREPISRITWMMLIFAIPVLGSLIYLLFGELFLSKTTRKRINESRGIFSFGVSPQIHEHIPNHIAPLFHLGESLNLFHTTYNNSLELLQEGYSSTKKMIEDIENAQRSIHLCFYIWLPDKAGLEVLAAIQHAYTRGVTCRILVDAVGSKLLIKTKEWNELKKLGCHLQVMFPIHKNFLSYFIVRQDIRNHRKIAIIDGNIAYTGSQNCCLPSFFPKEKYGPWVDVWTRITGPLVIQLENIFLSDWAMNTPENIFSIAQALHPNEAIGTGNMAAIPFATGPSEIFGALSEIFQTLMYNAKKSLWITTPYFVPTDAIVQAIISAARRGVEIKIMFPEKNDSPYVEAIAKSYYLELLEAGVKIYEFAPGILHSKILTMDDDSVFYGSANMDRRSFDINYENTLGVYSKEFFRQMRSRQEEYILHCREVTLQEVESWSLSRKIWNNSLAVLSPIF